MYTVNDNGFIRNRYVRNNIFQIFFLAYPVLGFITFFRYLVSNGEKRVFFFIVILPFSLGIFLFFIFVTLLMMKRWNRTIKEINFQNDHIIATSFSVLWLKSKQYSLSLSEINIKKSLFDWYGKEKKDGITITISKKIQLYLVSDYFDDYNKILSEMRA